METDIPAEPVHLPKGGNVALRSLDEELGSITVALETSGRQGVAIDADVSVLLLGTDGHVRSNEDFVFYNQPIGAAGAVHLRDKMRIDDDETPLCTDIVTLELDDVPHEIERIVLSASLDAGQHVTFGAASAVRMQIKRSSDARDLVFFEVADASSETALLFGEFYRRHDEWKLRAIGQGFDGGLAQLATEFGVDVDADEEDDDSGSEMTVDGEPEHTADGPVPAAPTSPASTVDEAVHPVDHEIDSTTAEPQTPTSDPDEPAQDTPSRVSMRREVKPPKLPADWDKTVPDPDTDWQRSRLFPIAGIGAGEEQERRATSALLTVMGMVRDFGRAVLSRFGAPAGRMETFIEVPFGLGEEAYRPDGVIQVTRAGRTWTALVEVKTGDAELSATQVDKYVDIARARKFDAVITISNQLAGPDGDHPVPIDGRKLKKVGLYHLAWDEIRAQAVLLCRHQRIDDATQQRVLDELIRYMTHQRSGLHGFKDMGSHWVTTRDAYQRKILRASDKGCSDVLAHYDQLIRHIGLRLTELLGVEASTSAPRRRSDASSRNEQLADSGLLFGSIKVPGTVGPMIVTTDLGMERVSCSIEVDAPREGRQLTRVNWLLRQLGDARDALRVEALLSGGRGQSTAELLGTVRADPETLLPADDRDIRTFRISVDAPMGTKRGLGKRGLIGSINTATTQFYGEVVQNLRPWRPRKPRT